jgi:hypothetical protein
MFPSPNLESLFDSWKNLVSVRRISGVTRGIGLYYNLNLERKGALEGIYSSRSRSKHRTNLTISLGYIGSIPPIPIGNDA